MSRRPQTSQVAFVCLCCKGGDVDGDEDDDEGGEDDGNEYDEDDSLRLTSGGHRQKLQ